MYTFDNWGAGLVSLDLSCRGLTPNAVYLIGWSSVVADAMGAISEWVDYCAVGTDETVLPAVVSNEQGLAVLSGTSRLGE